MTEMHTGVCGGHLYLKATTNKILRVGYYWPTLFKDAHAHAWDFKVWKMSIGRETKFSSPLQPITINQPFQ